MFGRVRASVFAIADASKARWEIVLGLLGASAGVTFVVYLVGAMVEVRRFEALKLPGAQTVAPLSRDSLIAVGSFNLVPPLFVAVAAAALFGVLVAVGRGTPARAHANVAAILVVVAIGTALTVAAGLGSWWMAVFVAFLEAAAALGWLRLRAAADRGSSPRGVVAVGAVVALAVGGVGATVVLVNVWRPPVDLEYAEVDLRNGDRVCGVYVALTDADLYLAPAEPRDTGYVTQRRIVALPRGDVARITLKRRTPVWDGGADEPTNLACP